MCVSFILSLSQVHLLTNANIYSRIGSGARLLISNPPRSAAVIDGQKHACVAELAIASFDSSTKMSNLVPRVKDVVWGELSALSINEGDEQSQGRYIFTAVSARTLVAPPAPRFVDPFPMHYYVRIAQCVEANRKLSKFHVVGNQRGDVRPPVVGVALSGRGISGFSGQGVEKCIWVSIATRTTCQEASGSYMTQSTNATGSGT